MARTQLEASLGHDNSIYSQDTYPNVKRSSFNLSARYDMTCDPGMYFPVDWWFTLPGDHFNISLRYILKSRPLVVAPFTPYHVRTHWFYCRLIDLWKGAPTWVTRGRSGNLRPDFPKINPLSYSFPQPGSDAKLVWNSPQSLSSYLRLNPVYLPVSESFEFWGPGYTDCSRLADNTLIQDSSTFVSTGYSLPSSINALIPFMYQKCYRFDMTIPNLLQDSKVWYPDDISDGWRIAYDSSNLGKGSEGSSFDGNFHPTSRISSIPCYASTSPMSPRVSDTSVNILRMRCCLFEKDRFSTALPNNLRGSAPTVELNTDVRLKLNGTTLTIPSTSVGSWALGHEAEGPGSSNFSQQRVVFPTAGSRNWSSATYTNSMNNTVDNMAFNTITKPQNVQLLPEAVAATVTGLKMDLNQFRSLIALTVWQERNMQTQGDYNDTIYAHFRTNPHHDDFEPKYIGGTSDVIYFDELVQDMPTNVNISGSNVQRPAGSRSGIVDQQSSGSVGSFTCPDYGFIMGIMFISPEVSYANGAERPWFWETMEDLYFPEDEGLGLQEVLNYEIRVTDSDAANNDIFGWQNRDTDMKSRQNRSLGFFSLPPSVDAEFSARSQSRIFTATPKLSHNLFVESFYNLRRDWLAKPNDPAFELNYATILHGNRPMAYRSIPETFGF